MFICYKKIFSNKFDLFWTTTLFLLVIVVISYSYSWYLIVVVEGVTVGYSSRQE
jgi:hypothetical protein